MFLGAVMLMPAHSLAKFTLRENTYTVWLGTIPAEIEIVLDSVVD